MDDLISRQAAIDEIDEWIKAFRGNGHKESAADACLIQDGIIQLPSAEPERKTGWWVEDSYYDLPCVCSYCGHEGKHEWNFCPNCGADMR